MQADADVAELEGLDKVIAWVKNIYIFGLFEGETGEEAPWYLKPVRSLRPSPAILARIYFIGKVVLLGSLK